MADAVASDQARLEQRVRAATEDLRRQKEEAERQARVDLLTGNLSGHVWGENVGWISLNNAQAVRARKGRDANFGFKPATVARVV